MNIFYSFQNFDIHAWLDLIWLPVALLTVHKGQRIKSSAFVLSCILTLRLQVEIIEGMGFKTGILGFLDSSLYHRGLVLYSLFIMLFLLLSWFSPNTKGYLYLAVSISLFFMAFTASSFIMVL